MTSEARKMMEKLDVTLISNVELKQLCKDRLDFGFDSIYFRYALAIDELKSFKDRYERDRNWDFWANACKKHFYATLEQLVHAHEDDKNDTNK